jgi:hypothetical protein
MSTTTHEFDPLLLYREEDGRAEFAMWRLTQGQTALAMFIDHEAAERYRQAAHLDQRWRSLQPDRLTLQRILVECHRGGVPFAVLDPNEQQGRRIFDIARILEGVARSKQEVQLND